MHAIFFMPWCLISQLSLLLIPEIDASRNTEESNLDLNNRFSKLEAKDRHQDGEMVLELFAEHVFAPI